MQNRQHKFFYPSALENETKGGKSDHEQAKQRMQDILFPLA
jgi:hypothetical protein